MGLSKIKGVHHPGIDIYIASSIFIFSIYFNWLIHSPFNLLLKSRTLSLPQSIMHSPTLFLSIFLPTLILPSLSNPLLPPRSSQQSKLPLPVKIIHQFPLGTWLENLAIRRNGNILTTAVTSPELFQVDDRGDVPPTVVHRFAGKSSCFGITELEDDIFYVIAGNFALATFTSVAGSYAVYEVNLRNYNGTFAAPVTKIAPIPNAQLVTGSPSFRIREKHS